MFFNYVALAISASIDSLGIGITYGLKNTKIVFSAKLVLFIISIIITAFSMLLGNFLIIIFPDFALKLIGSISFILIGTWVLYHALKKEPIQAPKSPTFQPKVYDFFINYLGITIKIIRNPISSDLDSSNEIDLKEAFYLGLALSLDSLCIGIGSSIIGLSFILFPLLVSIFQLLFISFGKFIGEKVRSISIIPENTWNIISAILLIFIGFTKLI